MAKQRITIPVFIPHSGCPHRCAFCDQWAATGMPWPPSPSLVDELVKGYAPLIAPSVHRIELAFFGGSFTGMDRELQEAYLLRARHHLQRGAIHGIRLSTRPDYISDTTVRFLADHGVSTIELGAQSFDDGVLAASHRGHDGMATIRAADIIRRHRLDLVIQLMPGLPGETAASALRSARIAAECSPSGVRIYPTVVLRGTPLEALYLKNAYRPLSLDEAIELCVKLHAVFERRGVPVIRTGIHPLAPDRSRLIVAGPYHPSFGHLVKSRLRREEMMHRALDHLARHGGARALRFLIPSRFAGEYIGHRKENIRHILRHFALQRVDYTVIDTPRVMIDGSI